MAVWKPDSISDEPEVILANWCVFEIDGKDRHFCGYNVILREGRVSSRIEEFDQPNMAGRTRSGRIYKLQGAHGWDSNARYVWTRWCNINGIDADSVRNVSEEIVNGR